jgi:ABC-type transport system involved in multi-copper enzyme maturation permease subunit
MKALLWKDYRLNRGLLVMGLVLWLAPYPIALTVGLCQFWPSGPTVGEFAEGIVATSFMSVGLSHLTLVTLAGNLIAAERFDRSAEFLASLPASRRQILASKALLLLLAITPIWASNTFAAAVLAPGLAPAGEGMFGPWLVHAALALMLCGTGWLGSALLDSPAFATSLGIGATGLVGGIFVLVFERFVPRASDALLYGALVAYVILGILCFVMGSAYYLRRVEP